jgi:hypothetical protein
MFGPDGDPNEIYNAFDLYSPFDFFSQGRLVAYIGTTPFQGHYGDPGFFPQVSGYFSIGSGQTFIAPYSGELWLGMNDAAVTESRADNKGKVIATVTIGNSDPVGPSIAIASPRLVYAQNRHVVAQYGCSDPGDTVTSCKGSVASGAAIDTSVPGLHGFTVVAKDSHGNTSSQTVGYVVTDSTQAAIVPVGALFEPTYVGSRSAVQSLYLYNPLAADITISNIGLDGNYNLVGTDCGATLAAFAHCMIRVQMQPGNTGTNTGALNVTASAPIASVPLRGIGTLVRSTPKSLTFTGRGVGTTSAPVTFTLQNSQPSALKIGQIVVTGDYALDPSTTCPVSGGNLAVNHGCKIAVTFSPQSTGQRNGSVLVHAGDPATVPIDPVSVSLSGNGI